MKKLNNIVNHMNNDILIYAHIHLLKKKICGSPPPASDSIKSKRIVKVRNRVERWVAAVHFCCLPWLTIRDQYLIILSSSYY